MNKMSFDEKARAIAELVVGMKRYEWAKVAQAVEKSFSSVSNRVELSDTDEIMELLTWEI